jgi:hypothetical protein
MNPTLENLHELIRQQASYASLVDLIQQRLGCTYLEACTRLNAELEEYRRFHAAS